MIDQDTRESLEALLAHLRDSSVIDSDSSWGRGALHAKETAANWLSSIIDGSDLKSRLSQRTSGTTDSTALNDGANGD